MANIINLPIHRNESGCIAVLENVLPFLIKRVYFIYDVTSKRGGHRHEKTIQALICLGGECTVFVNDGEKEQEIILDVPSKCVVLEPEDWHEITNFSKGSTLLVLASEIYNEKDYIFDKY